MKKGLFSFKLYITISSILIAIVLIFSLILYTNAKKQTLQSAEHALDANTQQMAYLLDNVFHQMDILSLQLTATPDLQDYFRLNLEDSIVNPEFEAVLNKIAAQFVLSFEYSTRITIYCPDGSHSSIGIPSNIRSMNSFFHSSSFQEWYALRNDFPGYTVLMPPQEDLWSNKDTNYISFVRRLNNSVSFKQVGLIEIQIAQASLQSIADSIGLISCEYYLIDRNHTVYLSSDAVPSQAVEFFLLEAQKRHAASFCYKNQYLINIRELEYSDLILLQVQSISGSIDIVDSFGSQMITICIALILFFLILIFFIIQTMTRPLRDLQLAISEISPIHDSCHSHNSADEFSLMQMSFLSLKDRLNSAIFEAVEAKTRQEHAQFVALQAQIDPHFTFNAISVIAATAISNGDMQIYEIASSFSDMLRYILSDPSETVSFSTELTHCEAYLRIMKYRYEDQLNVDITYPDTINALPLPKLCLQPLLENSFRHGFNSTLPPYSISLSVSVHEKQIKIQVQDNGSGISPERLAQLKALLHEPQGTITRTQTVGLGLRSTYLRMRQLYPDTSMELQPIRNGGFAVIITLTIQDSQLPQYESAVQEGFL